MAGRRLTIAARFGFRCALLSSMMACSALLAGCVVEVGEPDDEEVSLYESELEGMGDFGDPVEGASPSGDPGGDSSEPEPTPWRAMPDDSGDGDPTPPLAIKSTATPSKGGADEQ